jgi:hypothetical protein
MKRKTVDINKIKIEAGWEWFVFKKRSQRARIIADSGYGTGPDVPDGAFVDRSNLESSSAADGEPAATALVK